MSPLFLDGAETTWSREGLANVLPTLDEKPIRSHNDYTISSHPFRMLRKAPAICTAERASPALDSEGNREPRPEKEDKPGFGKEVQS